MPDVLYGIDVSAWQSVDTVKSWLARCSFVIVKASEGKSTKDKLHDTHVANARAAGKLVGHYHYAHPELNSAADEVVNFLRSANPRPGEVVVLDFEPYASTGGLKGNLSSFPAWIIAWGTGVYNKTGVWPWLYQDGNLVQLLMDRATASQWAVITRMPLWKARPDSDGPGSKGRWPRVACWQRTWKPLDQNTFYGDSDTWHSLAIPSTQKDWFDMTTKAEMSALLDERIEAHANTYAVAFANCRIYNPFMATKEDPKGPAVPLQDFIKSINTNSALALITANKALALIQALAAHGSDLTAAQIEQAAKDGSAAALKDIIDGATVTLNAQG